MNRVLRDEREILRRATAISASDRRCAFVRSSSRRRLRSATSPRRVRSCRSSDPSATTGAASMSIGCRHRHQHAERTPAGMPRSQLRACLEEFPELAQDENAGSARRRRPQRQRSRLQPKEVASADDDADRGGVHELHVAQVDHEIAVVERDGTGHGSARARPRWRRRVRLEARRRCDRRHAPEMPPDRERRSRTTPTLHAPWHPPDITRCDQALPGSGASLPEPRLPAQHVRDFCRVKTTVYL